MIKLVDIFARIAQLGYSPAGLCTAFGVTIERFGNAQKDDDRLLIGMMLFVPGELLARPEFTLTRCNVPPSGWIEVVRACFPEYATEPPTYDQIADAIRLHLRNVVIP